MPTVSSSRTRRATLPPRVADRLPAIRQACERFGVVRLGLFGSAVRPDFDEAHSDYDFVADYRDDVDTAWFGHVTGLAEALEHILGRPVDVVERPSGGDHRFARELDATQTIVLGDSPDPIQTPPQRRQLLKRDASVRKSEYYLQDIVAAVEDLRQFIGDKSFNDYLADKMLRLAVERLLINIGEAVARLRKTRPDLADNFTTIDQIVGFRNVLVHEYDDLNQNEVWDVLQHNLTTIQREAQRMIRDLQQG